MSSAGLMLIPHLIPDILLCLPVNALVRFRCLSKSLCHEIDSAAFAEAHLNRSIQTKTRRKLIFLDHDSDFSAIDLDLAGELGTPTTKVGNPSEFKDQGYSNRSIIYHGSCNGLLLLSAYRSRTLDDSGYELWLWNPFTRKSSKLPDCPGIICSGTIEFNRFGFGYDPLSNDYKVVRIQTHHWDRLYKPCKICEFSLGSNAWRDLPLPTPIGAFEWILRDAVFVDGALHWLSHIHPKNFIEYSIEIVSFDISEDKFVDLMPAIPPYAHSRETEQYDICLQVLEGSLVFCRRDPSSQHLDLYYAIKNVDEKQQHSGWTWTKLYNLYHSCFKQVYYPNPLKVFHFEESKDKILLQTSDADFLWYDLNHRSLKRLNIRQLPLESNFDDFLNFRRSSFCCETLVSPAPGQRPKGKKLLRN